MATAMRTRVRRCGGACHELALLSLSLATGGSYAQTVRDSVTTRGDSRFYLQLQTGLASEADFLPSLFFITDRSEERTYYDGISIGTQLESSIFGR